MKTQLLKPSTGPGNSKLSDRRLGFQYLPLALNRHTIFLQQTMMHPKSPESQPMLKGLSFICFSRILDLTYTRQGEHFYGYGLCTFRALIILLEYDIYLERCP